MDLLRSDRRYILKFIPSRTKFLATRLTTACRCIIQTFRRSAVQLEGATIFFDQLVRISVSFCKLYG